MSVENIEQKPANTVWDDEKGNWLIYLVASLPIKEISYALPLSKTNSPDLTEEERKISPFDIKTRFAELERSLRKNPTTRKYLERYKENIYAAISGETQTQQREGGYLPGLIGSGVSTLLSLSTLIFTQIRLFISATTVNIYNVAISQLPNISPEFLKNVTFSVIQNPNLLELINKTIAALPSQGNYTSEQITQVLELDILPTVTELVTSEIVKYNQTSTANVQPVSNNNTESTAFLIASLATSIIGTISAVFFAYNIFLRTDSEKKQTKLYNDHIRKFVDNMHIFQNEINIKEEAVTQITDFMGIDKNDILLGNNMESNSQDQSSVSKDESSDSEQVVVDTSITITEKKIDYHHFILSELDQYHNMTVYEKIKESIKFANSNNINEDNYTFEGMLTLLVRIKLLDSKEYRDNFDSKSIDFNNIKSIEALLSINIENSTLLKSIIIQNLLKILENPLKLSVAYKILKILNKTTISNEKDKILSKIENLSKINKAINSNINELKSNLKKTKKSKIVALENEIKDNKAEIETFEDEMKNIDLIILSSVITKLETIGSENTNNHSRLKNINDKLDIFEKNENLSNLSNYVDEKSLGSEGLIDIFTNSKLFKETTMDLNKKRIKENPKEYFGNNRNVLLSETSSSGKPEPSSSTAPSIKFNFL